MSRDGMERIFWLLSLRCIFALQQVEEHVRRLCHILTQVVNPICVRCCQGFYFKFWPRSPSPYLYQCLGAFQTSSPSLSDSILPRYQAVDLTQRILLHLFEILSHLTVLFRQFSVWIFESRTCRILSDSMAPSLLGNGHFSSLDNLFELSSSDLILSTKTARASRRH